MKFLKPSILLCALPLLMPSISNAGPLKQIFEMIQSASKLPGKCSKAQFTYEVVNGAEHLTWSGIDSVDNAKMIEVFLPLEQSQTWTQSTDADSTSDPQMVYSDFKIDSKTKKRDGLKDQVFSVSDKGSTKISMLSINESSSIVVEQDPDGAVVRIEFAGDAGAKVGFVPMPIPSSLRKSLGAKENYACDDKDIAPVSAAKASDVGSTEVHGYQFSAAVVVDTKAAKVDNADHGDATQAADSAAHKQDDHSAQ